MGKHIKFSRIRPKEEPRVENWKRRQRRKRLKARIAAERDYMADWVDRAPVEERAP